MQQVKQIEQEEQAQLANPNSDSKGTDEPLDRDSLASVQVYPEDKRGWNILKARLGMTSPETFRFSLTAAEEKLESSEKDKG